MITDYRCLLFLLSSKSLRVDVGKQRIGGFGCRDAVGKVVDDVVGPFSEDVVIGGCGQATINGFVATRMSVPPDYVTSDDFPIFVVVLDRSIRRHVRV